MITVKIGKGGGTFDVKGNMVIECTLHDVYTGGCGRCEWLRKWTYRMCAIKEELEELQTQLNEKITEGYLKHTVRNE